MKDMAVASCSYCNMKAVAQKDVSGARFELGIIGTKNSGTRLEFYRNVHKLIYHMSAFLTYPAH
jgi:hypothetical protein